MNEYLILKYSAIPYIPVMVQSVHSCGLRFYFAAELPTRTPHTFRDLVFRSHYRQYTTGSCDLAGSHNSAVWTNLSPDRDVSPHKPIS